MATVRPHLIGVVRFFNEKEIVLFGKTNRPDFLDKGYNCFIVLCFLRAY